IWTYQLILQNALEKVNLSTGLELQDIKYINRGQDKFVYSIPINKLKHESAQINSKGILATAIPINSKFDLYTEFVRLKELHNHFENKFSPTPEFYRETINSKILGMEYLDLPLIGEFVAANNTESVLQKLAYAEGFAAGTIHKKTGKFHVEPHNENLMVVTEGSNISVKFLDAIEFERGTLRDIVDTYIDKYSYDRTEVANNPEYFERGLEHSQK
ncbi:MAG: hypothetical protein KKF65_04985, partial [Nanoarchaeota archaeon]|nr:hypothetical protein [Nanoarchaeota archaeon]